MDVHLGSVMDGIDAAQAIRAQFDITTVFLSAFSSDANSARAQLAKPAGYLSKPFEDYELREVIEAAIQNRLTTQLGLILDFHKAVLRGGQLSAHPGSLDPRTHLQLADIGAANPRARRVAWINQ